MNGFQRRFFNFENANEDPEKLLRLERRSVNGVEQVILRAYAVPWNTDTLDGAVGPYVERIAPGAFWMVDEANQGKRSLMTKSVLNHNDDMPLAAYPKTLTLLQDDYGLYYEHPLQDTTYARDLITNIEAGIVRGSSFLYKPGKRNGDFGWSKDAEGRSVKTIFRAQLLLDVGPCTFPAYGEGDLSLLKRSFDREIHEFQEVRKRPDLSRFKHRQAELSRLIRGK
jgi:HK97 family phage prohead protease